MAERELGIVIRAKDLASRTIAGVNKQLGNIGSNVSRGLGNAVKNVERGIAAIGALAIGGIGFSLKMAGDFEAQLNTINTVAKVTPEVLGEIGDGIRKLARDTGTSHADLTSAYYDLVSAGIKAADAQNVLTAANTLAIGGLSTTAEAVDLLTTAINSYGGDASKAGLYADQFAQAIAAGKVTAAELAASFAQVGPLAAQMGIGVDEISASIGVMTAKGTPAAEAFTQIRAAMIALQRQTPEMQRVLSELGIADAALYADTYGLAPLYDKLATKAAELGIPLIELTGRVEGSMYAAQNAGAEFSNYEQALDDVRNSSGEAADQMSERQQGLNYQLARIRTLAADAAITIGSKLLPKITPLLEKLAEWADTNQAGIGKFADELADGVERAAKWAMSLDWGTIASSLQIAAGFARGVMEAFLKAPVWLQTAVLTGWGLNKLTGGALGSIIGQVITGGAKGLLGGLRGSSPVTPMYTKEVGLGGGPSGPGGKGPGGLPLLAPAAAIVVTALATQGGSDNPTAEMENKRIQLARDLDAGVINAAEAARLWAEAYGKTVTNPFVNNGPMGPPIPKMLSAATLAKALGFALPDTAINKPGAGTLPDTAMKPVTAAVQGTTEAVSDLPPLLSKASDTLQRVLGSSDRQRAAILAQSYRLQAIEGSVRATQGPLNLIASRKPVTNLTVPVTVNVSIPISATVMQQRLNEIRNSVGGGGFI